MVKTCSNTVDLCSPAPLFALPDIVSGKIVSLATEQSHVATVIMFICNHCPFVKHVNKQLTQLANDYLPKNIRFLAINSNDVESYPDDAPKYMKEVAAKEHYPFPYLFDETQEVAQAFQAACTPDFFIYDKNLLLAYHGQLDDSRPGNTLDIDGHSIRQALDCLISGQPVINQQKPSIGCSIKWKK